MKLPFGIQQQTPDGEKLSSTSVNLLKLAKGNLFIYFHDNNL